MDNYICKIATIDEMNDKWDYEIKNSKDDKEYLTLRKKENIERFKKGLIIQYYGILNGKIICECTAAISPIVVQNSDNLVDNKTAYLTAFRTLPEYQGKGYFSKLYRFMIEDLKNRGYENATLGVEPKETKNKDIYFKYGFREHIKDSTEVYSDGTKIDVEYYGKKL